MIRVSNLYKQLNNKTILEDVSFTINRGDRIALIGDNGSGKSTLLNIIIGSLEPDKGEVEVIDERLGLLPQKINFENGQTVRSFLLDSNNQFEDNEYLLDQLLIDNRLEYIDKNTPVRSLSGGEKVRLYLASLFFRNTPTSLLLDEPTNNLDEQSIDWIKEFLSKYNGAVLFVSHDRHFINTMANEIFELNEGKIKVYGGNYSFYLNQKQIEAESYERLFIVQQKKIKRAKEDIVKIRERARTGELKIGSDQPFIRRKIRQSARIAVARERKLNKYIEDENTLERLSKKREFKFTFQGRMESGNIILEIKDISKSFNQNKVINNMSFSIYGNKHILIKGANGSGKTTLFKIIIGEILPDKGNVKISKYINIGYLSQDVTNLDENNTILDELISFGLSKTDAYKYATKFNIDANELDNKIESISAGQKALISIAKFIYKQYQLIILDEPTNHLDIKTREKIEEALNTYKGALLISSHDKYFIEKVGIDETIEMH